MLYLTIYLMKFVSKSGAYGAMFNIVNESNIIFMSYRDPKLKGNL